ncbi:hypothetical protein EXIGLDRAFT_729066 [Exidia glandulosa HHB12029]|uniref:Uncharacterized protein n=1 Tax=Exidia glandulosa HHB12029 TaxID=1314781 RepID=A0A165CRY5_EXIGL|nr:hypothetical protein EXIGLDRAFT_729066 [Exidia glandulosa HHB12029]
MLKCARKRASRTRLQAPLIAFRTGNAQLNHWTLLGGSQQSTQKDEFLEGVLAPSGR